MKTPPIRGSRPGRRPSGILVALTISGWLAAFLWVNRAVVFGGECFAFRDAGTYFYPLYGFVNRQWAAGEIPLWNDQLDFGCPLAGNPVAAVFYPGRLLFLLLPYGVAFAWFHLLHLVLAGVAAAIGARWIGLRRWGALFVGVTYSLGGNLLFQANNTPFLIGAAWLPLAFAAAWRIATDVDPRRRRLRSVVVGALAVALMVLGGDAEMAYVVIVFLFVATLFEQFSRRSAWLTATALAASGWLWVRHGGDAGPGTTWSGALVRFFCVLPFLVTAAIHFRYWRKAETAARRPCHCVVRACCLVGLAAILSLPQLAATGELIQFTSRSFRIDDVVTYRSAFHPSRFAELVAPGIFGRHRPVNGRWFPAAVAEGPFWSADLYQGAWLLPLLALGFRLRGHRTRRMASVTFIAGLLASFGPFIGWEGIKSLSPNAPVANEPFAVPGGFYWLLESVLPGWSGFRYPGKLFVLTSFAGALLAGWTLERAGRRGQSALLAGAAALGGGCILLWITLVCRPDWFESAIGRRHGHVSAFGPLDVASAGRDTAAALRHAAIVLLAPLAIASILQLRRRTGNRDERSVTASTDGARLAWVAFALVATTSADLATSQKDIVWTVPIAELEKPSRLAEVIRRRAGDHPADGAPRVYVSQLHWFPERFDAAAKSDRFAELVAWQRDTLCGLWGLGHGVEPVNVFATIGLAEMEELFVAELIETSPALRAVRPSAPPFMRWCPKSAYDAWAVEAFALPSRLVLDDIQRGNATLIADRAGMPLQHLADSPVDVDDFQLLANREALPRQRIAHQAEFRSPGDLTDASRRRGLADELSYRVFDGGIKMNPGPPFAEKDLGTTVVLETDERARWLKHLATPAPSATDVGDRVIVASRASSKVEYDVTAATPGFLVIAESLYPGWSATVDGLPQPVLRANRGMRCIPVPAGRAKVVMRHRNRTVEFALVVSGLVWLSALASVVTSWRLQKGTA